MQAENGVFFAAFWCLQKIRPVLAKVGSRANREQGTGNRQQGTREQGTREQGTREQGTGNREQATGNRQQGTREQATGNEGTRERENREQLSVVRERRAE
jgi:hypothetical protein